MNLRIAMKLIDAGENLEVRLERKLDQGLFVGNEDKQIKEYQERLTTILAFEVDSQSVQQLSDLMTEINQWLEGR